MPDAAPFVDLCRSVESQGIESIHVPLANSLSDALTLAIAAGMETAQVKFRIGWNFPAVLASLRGHDMKNAWAALPNRLVFHLHFGHSDFCTEETEQAGEFITNCRALFHESKAPAFEVEGETAEAAFLAIKHSDCLWRLPNRVNQVYADALPVLHFGKEVGLVSAVITRETRQEAFEAAATLLPEHAVERLDDRTVWITPHLWIGMLPGGSEKTAALVGSFEEVARAILEFKRNGISQFRVRGSRESQEMACFGARVIPLVRAME